MTLSLFGGKKHLHHFVAEQDVAKELFALLVEAKTMYLRDVVTGNKQYYRYVEDFVNSHRYIDCDHAVCRNCHEMNIHIVKGLLNDCSHLIRAFFTEADFSFEKCMELKRTYDTFVPPSQSVTCCKDGPTRIYPLSFGCNLTRKQMIGITACANAYHLFCVSTLHVEDMEALLSCKEGFCIRVNNIRHVAILFDTLLEHSFIQAKWQSVLSSGRFLQTKDGKGFVSASSLSSALSALRNNDFTCFTSGTDFFAFFRVIVQILFELALCLFVFFGGVVLIFSGCFGLFGICLCIIVKAFHFVTHGGKTFYYGFIAVETFIAEGYLRAFFHKAHGFLREICRIHFSKASTIGAISATTLAK